jgi:hypothetical protein
MSRGLGKKGVAFASPDFDVFASSLSKAALVDIIWGLCQLGTDESGREITIKFAREARCILPGRGDPVPAWVSNHENKRIDSDHSPEDL